MSNTKKRYTESTQVKEIEFEAALEICITKLTPYLFKLFYKTKCRRFRSI